MNWKPETLSRKPERFEKANDVSWIERKNIEKHTDTDPTSGEPNTYYSCHMRFISNEEYMALNTINTADDITKLKEALADIYIELLSK